MFDTTPTVPDHDEIHHIVMLQKYSLFIYFQKGVLVFEMKLASRKLISKELFSSSACLLPSLIKFV